MGFPPPPNLPPPAPAGSPVTGAFEAGPPAASLCGFTIPTFRFKIAFNLPPLNFPPNIPFPPYLAFGINCNLNNPIDVSAGLPRGGGRIPNNDPSPDLNEDAP